MPLEDADNILGLNPANPTGDDPKNQGDDQIRMLKRVLIEAFPLGAVLFNTTGENPSNYIGGTWEAYSEGALIAGAASGDTGGEKVGSDTITIGIANLPASKIALEIAQVGNHTHTYDRTENVTDAGDTGFLGGNNDAKFQQRTTGASGAHTHTGTTANLGSGAALPLDPTRSLTFAWVRTA